MLAAAAWLSSIPAACALLGAVLIAALLGGLFSKRRLGGGLTGDAYGFLVTVLEVLILVVLSCGRFGL